MQAKGWLAIGILAFFLVLSMLSVYFLEQSCNPVMALLEQACEEAALGNFDQAQQMATRASALWHQNRNRIAALFDHNPMDEIDGLFSQANMYARMGNLQDFSATCARLHQLIDAITDANQLTWWNLL